MVTFSDSNRASLRFIKESNTAWGITPTTGVTKEMRITSSSLAASKETVVSDELRSDRMVSAVTEVSAATAGDINFEYSAGAQDDFLEAFLLGAYTKAVPFFKFEGTTVSIASATTIDIVGGDFTASFANGEQVRLSGFKSAVNNDFANVVSSAFAANTTTLTISGPTLVAEAGNSKSKVQSADDVFLARDITISSGATGFSSTGTPFTGMETSGLLVVGMKINVTGLGHETGTFTAVTTPADAETITVDDGAGGVTVLEFDVASDGVAAGNVAVDASGTPTVTILASRIAAAIMTEFNKGNINVTAISAIGVVTVKNLGKTGATLTDGTGGNITVAAFTGGDDTANGIFTIDTIADGLIGVTPVPGVVAAGAKVTMQASMLRNPNGVSGGTRNHEVIQPQSLTVETGFNDISQFFQSDGLRAGTFSLSVASGSIVTGTIGLQGKETKRTAVEKLGLAPYTVLAAPTNQVMNATTNVGTIQLNGVDLVTAIQSIEFSGESSLRNQAAVGNKFPAGIGTGRFNLTGTLVAYFANADLYNAFIDHTTVSLSFDFTDLDSNVVSYTFPALKFTADPISPAGIDQDILENLEFMAFRDAATKSMIQVDRFSNVTPAGSQA